MVRRPTLVRFVVRFYSELLRWYPRDFRAEFGEEMQAVFAEAAQTAHRRSRLALFALCLRELWDWPGNLWRICQPAMMTQEVNMQHAVTDNAIGSWRDAALAGLPHIWYALMLYFPRLEYDLRTHGLAVALNPLGDYPRYNYFGFPWFWSQAFWIAVIALVVIGLWRRVPRWSASWIGYGLLGLLDRAVNVDPNLSLVSVTLLLSWLALAAGSLFWLGRRDPLTGLLAILPLAPMAFWSLEMDVVISNLEGFVYLPAGLLMSLAAALAVRSGRFRVGVWASLAVILLAGLPIHYSSAYYPSPTFPAPATPGAVVQSSIGDLVGLVLVGAPLWLLLAWRRWRGKPGVA